MPTPRGVTGHAGLDRLNSKAKKIKKSLGPYAAFKAFDTPSIKFLLCCSYHMVTAAHGQLKKF